MELQITIGLLSALLTAALLSRIRKARLARRSRCYNVRGKRGERDAEHLLRGLGYRIDERQARASWPVECDGVPRRIRLRADFVVSRNGKRCVAEVKTGDRAPQLSNVATRRQLLEYSLAYDVDHVLLVDPTLGRVFEVSFPGSGERTGANGVTWLLTFAYFVVGAVVGGGLTVWLTPF